MFRPNLLAKAAAAAIVVSAVPFLLLGRRGDSDSDNSSSYTMIRRALSGHGLDDTPGCAPKSWWSDYRVSPENPSHEIAMRELLSRYGTSSVNVDGEPDDMKLADVKDALAIQFLAEVDGDPVVVEGLDSSLFLGTIGAAYNLDGLLRKGITHIVSASRSARVNYPDRFEYLKVEVSGAKKTHKSRDDMMELFESTSAFIHQAVSTGGRVLVHDFGGEGRSSSFIIAYMMKHRGFTFQAALDRIKRTRPTVQPTMEYAENLIRWEEGVGLDSRGDGHEMVAERKPLSSSAEKVAIVVKR